MFVLASVHLFCGKYANGVIDGGHLGEEKIVGENWDTATGGQARRHIGEGL